MSVLSEFPLRRVGAVLPLAVDGIVRRCPAQVSAVFRRICDLCE